MVCLRRASSKFGGGIGSGRAVVAARRARRASARNLTGSVTPGEVDES